jgi:acyl transferase domain-containing protein/SAM-dependent methyltransferase
LSEITNNPAGHPESAALSPVKRALQEIRELRTELAAAEEAAASAQAGPIAIVGVGMRFPGGITDLGSFWRLLESGVDAITDIPLDRWDWRQYLDRNPEARGAMYAVRGGFLDDIAGFDADFFGIAAREAAMVDPQQRLLLEVMWHALEDAAIAPDSLRDARAGIFVGLSNSDYYRALCQDDLRIDAYAGTGTAASTAAGRLAYTLGVHGPAMTVDTACSSSLTAVHLAVQSLRSGESDVALAGGVNAILAPQMHIAGSKARMLSPDGYCKTFDQAADGYVRSEGCGVLVLKRLKDAEVAGDRVLAVIRGTALNQDGRSGGLTAPSSTAQAALLREAYAKAGVPVDAVGMIEAHGTGTSLGDPIEMEALGEVFRARTSGLAPIAVGSVKTNLGHAEAASGMAGLLKVVASLRHRKIPAHLHLKTPSAFVPWSELPFVVSKKTVDWPLPAGQMRRVAGVSSFGFSGTNAHVVLEEAIASETAVDAEAGPELVVISARTAAGRKRVRDGLAGVLETRPEYGLGDVARTLAWGRNHFAYREAYVVSSHDELIRRLREDSLAVAPGAASPPLCFLFTGQGSERAGMGLELLEHSPMFRAAVDRLDLALAGTLGQGIASIWANTNGELSKASLVQPALYAYGWALSELWRSWGVEPQVVLGHSLGEYVAATVAGVMAPEEGIRLVAARGRLTETLAEPGGMVAVVASVEDLRGLCSSASGLSIAAVNGPASVVLSGGVAAVDRLEVVLRERGLRHKRLRTTHGFHSTALEPMLDAFEAEAAKVEFKLPEVRWISNLTGIAVGREKPVDAAYWRRHLRETVRFADGVATANAVEDAVFVEVGGEPQLLALAEGNGIEVGRQVASVSKSGPDGEWHRLLTAAGRLYTLGADLDWTSVSSGSFRKLSLPGYPFERKRFWFEEADRGPEKTWKAMAAAGADQATMVPIVLDAARITERQGAVNGWATALIFSTLKSLGCFAADGDRVSGELLVSRYGVVSGQQSLIERWLRRLAGEGVLAALGSEEYSLVPSFFVPEAEALWAEALPLLKGDEPLRDYLANCARILVKVLRGELNALETLFPGGDGELAKALYERSPASAYVNRIAAAAIAARARSSVKTAGGFRRRLRVLEIGAGTGSTTASVLAQLGLEQVIYTYSDVSEMFLTRARQRFRDHAMEFVLFDLDREEDAAAHEGRYDVVLIANALHAARDLRLAIERVRRVLQPGGSIVLVETTAAQAWHDVSTGLIEGWQHVDEARSGGSPLIAVEKWASELEGAGFVGFSAQPSPELPTNALGLHVLLAQKPSDLLDQVLRSSDEAGVRSSIDVAVSDTADGEPAEELAGVSANRVREQVAEAPVKERLALAIEQTVTAVALALGRSIAKAELPAKDARLMDIGIDSLMAVELRNRLQTVFGVADLPSTLIFDYPTSEAIAQMILLRMGFGSESGEVTIAAVEVEEAVAVHSEEELDAMSEDEIAELLRLQLEQ